ncbi:MULTISPECIES: heterodisulfide reductase-related iron-sulfur binding cluster [Acidithiobacillus]|uniref:Fe-S oxidoreductase n=2 Tax=Acidithiobacillus thiooxidans TaxID=930 RepID=A0A1C2IP41_ACITH|nr:MULTISPECIES: heterodisulfide reductase-related iron-sulfur binding cluster [Acidithiobacillus]MBU2835732.1 Fe-S oxidoreductase [Acidithiobacillus thiooxidans]MBU2859349.1 Fe-S oxidoreductase [Acidithiobacillus ferrooxidans]MDA8176295.1 heterodisulfide reductase-related iron-sulfur binding cluster [Acidithiobacillus sp.]OCX73999.1 Fe-S oxidoreductase [Acidithiobacillus thiooxidans]OCX77749.1 Fe-S oxidoreductase [Acidithiobacillus thiooxidans]
MADDSSQQASDKAPYRHPIDWKHPDFFNQEKLDQEMERVFDICHTCRRCVSLCHSFPTLFDLIDESPTMELDSVNKKDFQKVVEQCFLCDLCFMTKCPYVPPHEWNVDFPHLMLRGKVVHFQESGASLRDRTLTSTDLLGKLAGIPVVSEMINRINKSPKVRSSMEKAIGIAKDAPLPPFAETLAKQRLRELLPTIGVQSSEAGEKTTGKVALFSTCYGEHNDPDIVLDLARVYAHNNIQLTSVEKQHCCGMPKLELGDLHAVERAKQANIPQLLELVNSGYDIVAPIPSCVLMFKNELPLLFPDDEDVQRVRRHLFDPMEYLSLRLQEGLLRTDFQHSLGKVTHHAACHQRVQNIGSRAREILSLVPETEVEVIERCSGHDGTYTVKAEFHAFACKIGKPVANQMREAHPDHWGSDCPLAATQIEKLWGEGAPSPQTPWRMLAYAYGLV